VEKKSRGCRGCNNQPWLPWIQQRAVTVAAPDTLVPAPDTECREPCQEPWLPPTQSVESRVKSRGCPRHRVSRAVSRAVAAPDTECQEPCQEPWLPPTQSVSHHGEAARWAGRRASLGIHGPDRTAGLIHHATGDSAVTLRVGQHPTQRWARRGTNCVLDPWANPGAGTCGCQRD
jgi:hypothetical protein